MELNSVLFIISQMCLLHFAFLQFSCHWHSGNLFYQLLHDIQSLLFEWFCWRMLDLYAALLIFPYYVPVYFTSLTCIYLSSPLRIKYSISQSQNNYERVHIISS
ncbi:hypothetical protein GUJ93_ZPchr0013g34380 [Zizania palustris]|uniref:Uncharacterized protein n=1 Tax=Zizania palustris TaxID=103762 RepID=A0A8J6C1F5_ZIZPA|nr:hypothetical protein GUJ93_ZPchr0013g34380 [Zizania palustris]